MKQKLSLCIVVNNGKYLEECLESTKGLVDEIVIVLNDQLNDNTQEIASKYGTQITKHQWDFDFAEAMNLGLKNATGNWILSINEDEKFSQKDHNKIEIAIHQKNVDGYYLMVSGKPEVRLFKNNDKYHFVNPIHETVEEAIISNKGKLKQLFINIESHGRKITDTERQVYLKHFLEKSKKNPNEPKHLFNASRIYLELGELDKSLEMLDKIFKINSTYANVARNIADIFLEKQYYKEAMQWYNKHLESNPNDIATHINLGIIHSRTEEFEQAEKFLKKAIELDSENVAAYDNLIAVFIKKKEFDRAAKTATLAYKITKIPKYGEAVLLIAKKVSKAGQTQNQ